MELLQELTDTEQGGEKYHWKDGEAHGRSGEHSVGLETSVNDRSYGRSNGKWKLEWDKIKITFRGMFIFTITLFLFFCGIGQIIELLCLCVLVDQMEKMSNGMPIIPSYRGKVILCAK